jgi:hypothetical protein
MKLWATVKEAVADAEVCRLTGATAKADPSIRPGRLTARNPLLESRFGTEGRHKGPTLAAGVDSQMRLNHFETLGCNILD